MRRPWTLLGSDHAALRSNSPSWMIASTSRLRFPFPPASSRAHLHHLRSVLDYIHEAQDTFSD